MRVVDEAIFEWLEDHGCWVPELHSEDEVEDVQPADTLIVHDGLMTPPTLPGELVVINNQLPYAVYHSSIGDDDRFRLGGPPARRSVFFSLTYVGGDRRQAKAAGERLRTPLQRRRIPVTGHRTWLCTLEESQRVRRDDDAVLTDGSPLFYGVDNYALPITLVPEGV